MAGEREEGWHPARLIPTAGIRGQEEQERRATSSLLAVMGAVPEFGRAILAALGAPRGRISTCAEVQLNEADGKLDPGWRDRGRARPDAVEPSRGGQDGRRAVEA